LKEVSDEQLEFITKKLHINENLVNENKLFYNEKTKKFQTNNINIEDK
jgi:hypothetical protein